MSKQKILILLSAVFGGILLSILLYGVQKNSPAKDDMIAVTDDVFGVPFALTNQDGKTITEKDFAEKYQLIYFGFTFCPAICPTELSKITTALKSLSDRAKNIQPIFITVDPERDTAEKLKNYVSLFHPSLVGLTGTPDQIKDVLKGYKIFAAKVQENDMNDYTMDHSSFIYFIAPDGRLLHIFKMQDSAADMEAVITQWLNKKP